jgi:hypothetical protein
MKMVTFSKAQNDLVNLIHLVEQGKEDFIIHKNAEFKLVLVTQPAEKCQFGQHRGKIRISSSFD